MSKITKESNFFNELNLPSSLKERKYSDCVMMTIDGSTQRTGVSLFLNGELWKTFLFGYVENSKVDIEERTDYMIKTLYYLLNEYHPYIIYMEDTYQGKNAKSYKYLCRIQGAVLGWTLLNDKLNAEFNLIYPAEWRKDLGFKQGKLKRNEYKEMAIDYIMSLYNIKVQDDAAESICIGLAIIKKFQNL